MIDRRRFLIGAAVLCGLPASYAQEAAQANRNILVVGDSLSAEYGLRRGSGWVSIIADKLKTEKYGVGIANASISGDTTSGGLSRFPAALSRHQPGIVIIELGSNDALRGLSLQMTQDNLSTMVSLAQKAGAKVLLVGMQIPPNYGRNYTEKFRQLFIDVAAQRNTALVPFLLERMADKRELFQADGIHPNEDAQPILARNVWVQLKTLLGPAAKKAR